MAVIDAYFIRDEVSRNSAGVQAIASLHRKPTAQECDATGDAIKTIAGIKKSDLIKSRRPIIIK